MNRRELFKALVGVPLGVPASVDKPFDVRNLTITLDAKPLTDMCQAMIEALESGGANTERLKRLVNQ